MSVEAMSWAFTVPLKPCPKSVLVALANRADEDGYCWPGLDDLERRTGWKRRAIQLAIRHLVDCQLITVTPRFQASAKQDSNLYRLSVGSVPPATDTTTSCGEGAPHAPRRVHHVHGEGAPHAPKSSSEQSVEQSSEVGAPAPTVSRSVMTNALWSAYAGAYERRYGVEPVRNRSVNAMLCKVIEKLGATESPPVAEFYVSHQSRWYAEKMHPVNLLLQDAEKLRTEWVTGRQALGRFDQERTRPKSLVDLL